MVFAINCSRELFCKAVIYSFLQQTAKENCRVVNLKFFCSEVGGGGGGGGVDNLKRRLIFYFRIRIYDHEGPDPKLWINASQRVSNTIKN
jgi:hypothetical protein